MKIIYKPNNKIVLQIKPENKEDQSILIQYIQSLKEAKEKNIYKIG